MRNLISHQFLRSTKLVPKKNFQRKFHGPVPKCNIEEFCELGLELQAEPALPYFRPFQPFLGTSNRQEKVELEKVSQFWVFYPMVQEKLGVKFFWQPAIQVTAS